MIAQPNDLFFPTKEFAEAICEFRVDLGTAMPFVPLTQQNYLGSCYQREVDPDYYPWGYCVSAQRSRGADPLQFASETLGLIPVDIRHHDGGSRLG
jgi:hypothetical protein